MAIQALTNEQEQEYNRSVKLSTYFAEHPLKVNAFVPLKNRVIKLDLHLNELTTIAQGKLPTTGGITQSKANLKKAVGIYYEQVCGVARAYCLDTDRLELADNLNFTEAKIIALLDGDVKTTVGLINGLITDNLIPQVDFADYGITPAILTAGADKAQAFADAIGKAGTIDAGKSAAGTAVIAKIHELQEDSDLLELLMRNFITSDVDFYNGFLAANVVDDIGVHHSGIEGLVETVDGTPIKGAVLLCVELDKKKVSDIVGHYEIKKMRGGTYTFNLTHPSYQPKSEVIKIKQGKTLSKDWTMIPL